MVQATPTDLEKNFLDEEGLNYFWGKIDNAKVDKVTGKGLSTNDYTTTEKNKLSGIATGAEVNQNAFSNVSDGTNTIAASGKTDTFTIAAASGTNGTSVSADTSTKTVKISSPKYTMTYTSSGTGGTLKLNEGIGGVVSPVATVNRVGFISDAERTKISSLPTRTVLYTATAFSNTITLSETKENFDEIEVFYEYNNIQLSSKFQVKSGSQRTLIMYGWWDTTTNVAYQPQGLTFNGTSVTYGYNAKANFTSGDSQMSYSGNNIIVTKIVGYKY